MIRLERQAMIASAGSGKTYQLSGRYIRLLALGIEPGRIFASTFTRKAAGEILGRVLKRLADASLDAKLAAELAAQTQIASLDSPACSALLCGLVRQMHRLNIGTLDRFFNRAAMCYSLELGLTPGWSIADSVHNQQLKLDAINTVLEQDDGTLALPLLRAIAKGEGERAVLEKLSGLIDELHRAFHQAQPEAWSFIQPDPSDLLDDREKEELYDQVNSLDYPRTQKGEPDQRWTKAIGLVGHDLSTGDYASLVSRGIVSKVVNDEPYYKSHATPSIQAWIKRVVTHSVAALMQQLVDRLSAMRALATAYDAALWQARQRSGLFAFDDITRALGGDNPLTAEADIFFRLDGRLEHILLDEFQDTSVDQWRVLQPIIDEAAQSDGDRALLLVADPKQSIYGWRGGEPRLVNDLVKHYQLDTQPLAVSWRTSQVVLDVVNDVFSSISMHPVLSDYADAAAQWSAAFAPHTAARADQPGHVRLDAVPILSNAEFPAALAVYAAQQVHELASNAPGFSIGVLVRDNKAVARMIFELGRMGIAASDEGGNPLTDSPAVTIMLALLTLADHPGDKVARYMVTRTAVSAVVGLSADATDEMIHRVARDVRQQLLVEGYGPTLSQWAQKLASFCDQRDMQRLLQLVQLGWQYQANATLRPGDFVEQVRQTRAQAPSPAAVRVMTIHASKGLEFDAVVLPQLGSPMIRSGNELLFDRTQPTGPITAICPRPPKGLADLCPDIAAIVDAHSARQITDGLSTLYVAMTRARYALHMIVGDKHAAGESVRPMKIIVSSLCSDDLNVLEAPKVLHERGDPQWMTHPKARPSATASTQQPTVLAPRLGRLTARRSLTRRTPSQAEGGPMIDLAHQLRLDRTGLSRGSLMHRLFEQVTWLDDGPPDRSILREAIADRASEYEVDELISAFDRAIAQPPIAAALCRSAYPAGAVLEVQVERRFAVIDEHDLLEGTFDRLVVQRHESKVIGAHLLDYKSDTGELNQIKQHYQPQIDAYRRAVALLYGLEPGQVTAGLVCLRHGQVVRM